MASRRSTLAPQIALTAGGKGSIQVGVVQGDLKLYGAYADYAESSHSEAQIDSVGYRQRLHETLSSWASRYTVLDVEPVVSVLSTMILDNQRKLKVTDAITEFNRLVILGNPGAGKTATLQFVAQSMSGTDDREKPFCILIDLGQFRVSRRWSPLECLLILVGERLQVGGAAERRFSLAAVDKFLGVHNIVFLFDGLNEVAIQNRSFCRQAIDDFAIRYPHSRYVVTSRVFGFSPWPDWTIVALRDLDQQGIRDLIAKYTDTTTALHLLEVVLDSRNELLTVPLFLSYVIQLRNLPDIELKHVLQSRSGLIRQYVSNVLETKVSGKASAYTIPELWNSLSDLAIQIQRSGQSLAVEAVLEGLQAQSQNPDRAKTMLVDLCERGILVDDGRYVRFWHHTLQEFFYCSALVKRWHKKPFRPFGQIPRWLKKHIKSEGEEEALKYFVAHLDRKEELDTVTRFAVRHNPRLATSWVDDVVGERRCPELGNIFLTRIRIETGRAIRYSRISEFRRSVLVRLLILFGVVLVTCAVSGASSKTYALAMATFALIFGDVLWHYRGRDRFESLLMPLVNIRNQELKAGMIDAARAGSRSMFSSKATRELAKSLSALRLDEGLKEYMARRIAIYETLTGLAHVDDPLVFSLLERLLKYNNLYARRAIRVLIIRANRFPSERERLKELAWDVVRQTPDWALLRLARRFLRQCGERPPRLAKVLFEPLGRSLVFVAVFSIFILVADSLIPDSLTNTVSFWVGWAISYFIQADARSINAARVSGYRGFDSWSPGGYGIAAFALAGLAAPAYIALRDIIRRNGVPLQSDDLHQFIRIDEVGQALEVHFEQISAL